MKALESKLQTLATQRPSECAEPTLMGRDLCLLSATLLLHILQIDREQARQAESSASAGQPINPIGTRRQELP